MRLLFALLWHQARRHPWKTGVTMTLMVAVSALWVIDPIYSRWAVDTLLQAKDGLPVPYALVFGGWGALVVTMAITQALEKYWSWEIDNVLFVERRQEIYNHVLHLDVSFHSTQKMGEVIKILEEGADQLVELQRETMINFLPSALAAIVFLIIGLTIEPILVGVLLVSITIFILIAVFGIQRTEKLQRQINRMWVVAIGRAYDAVLNISSVKSGAQEKRELGVMEQVQGEALRKQRAVNYRWAIIESLNVFQLSRILLIGIGIVLYVHNRLSLGELYFFQSSFFRVLTPFEILSGILPQWNKRIGKIRMSEEILQTPIFVKTEGTGKTIKNLKGAITLDDVCFAYERRVKIFDTDEEKNESLSLTQHSEEEPTESAAHVAVLPETQHAKPVTPESIDVHSHQSEVLHNVTLNIRAGERIAFVGHSGAGKTTMAMLLSRFYDVTLGKISIDGTDLRELDLQWWRSQIGLVLQDNILFNDTVLENIRYARPSATEAEVIDAATRAAAHEFIQTLPKGYQSLIGDRGIRLSGGQRQRVAIARAILKDPKIVLLDEATSALDSVTEREVQRGIESLTSGRTSCIIAHRLSTVRSCDRIAVFDKGCLIACAPHEELLKTCPIYKEMVELQSHGMLAEE